MDDTTDQSDMTGKNQMGFWRPVMMIELLLIAAGLFYLGISHAYRKGYRDAMRLHENRYPPTGNSVPRNAVAKNAKTTPATESDSASAEQALTGISDKSAPRTPERSDPVVESSVVESSVVESSASESEFDSESELLSQTTMNDWKDLEKTSLPHNRGHFHPTPIPVITIETDGLRDLKSGRYARAVSFFSHKLLQAKADHTSLFYRGLAYEKLGLLNKALMDYEQASKLSATESLYSFYLAGILFEQGSYADAAGEFLEANRKAGGDSGSALYNAAVSLQLNGQIPDAVLHYQKAMRAGYVSRDLILRLSKLYIEENQFTQARKLLLEAMTDPSLANPAIPYLLGETHRMQKEPEAAIGYYKKALAMDPGYNLAWVKLRASLQEAGRDKQAGLAERVLSEPRPSLSHTADTEKARDAEPAQNGHPVSKPRFEKMESSSTKEELAEILAETDAYADEGEKDEKLVATEEKGSKADSR